MYWKGIIGRVKEEIGKEVVCLNNNKGSLEAYIGRLKGVTEEGIDLGHIYLPFVGDGSYIEIIILKNEEKKIYENPSFANKTDKRCTKDGKVRCKTVLDIAFSLYIGDDESDEKRKAVSEAIARLKVPYLIKEGLPFIKDELKEEWKKFVNESSHDLESSDILETCINVMKELNNGTYSEDIRQMIHDKYGNISKKVGKFSYSDIVESYIYITITKFTSLKIHTRGTFHASKLELNK